MFGIFKNEYSERPRRLFADQFEVEGDGYIYRNSQKGPAIRITADERDRFIRNYDRSRRHSTWMIMIGLLLVTLGFVLWSSWAGTDLSDSIMYTAIGTVAAISIGYMLWSWGAPARELQKRTPISAERSREEMKQIMLAKLGYGQLAGTTAAAVVACWSLAAKNGGFSGWGLLWVGLAAITVFFAAVSAYRKWRFDQR